jgi:hypothetical protein
MTDKRFIFTAEFRAYFEHVRGLRFDDRPDYDYLKRLFRELFFRKNFCYDNVYDWDLVALRQQRQLDDSSVNEQVQSDNEIPSKLPRTFS